jgi:DNA polymerase-1
LRAVAEISGDATMTHAYRTGQDLHRLTASLLAHKPLAAVTKEERQAAKAVNFGLVFAMGARGLQEYAQTTYGVTMTLDDAEAFRRRFFEVYAGIAAWHNTLKRSRTAVARTLAGRVHYWRQEAGLTGLCNYPVQGTAADIAKQALADLVPALRGSAAKIVGMVHDEILLELPVQDVATAAHILKTTMERAGARYLHQVPVVAEAVVADSWAEK